MCEYVFGGMDEARGRGSFFVNCGTFYDYVLIALPAPWIFFFFFFFARLVPVYFILFTHFILDHRVLMDKASYICPIYGPEWRGLWIQDQ